MSYSSKINIMKETSNKTNDLNNVDSSHYFNILCNTGSYIPITFFLLTGTQFLPDSRSRHNWTTRRTWVRAMLEDVSIYVGQIKYL